MAAVPEVCEQLHLPLQSGSNRVLSAMRRGYTAERYLERLAAARAAIDDLGVTTDIIVGFPGETEQDFEDTLAVVAEAAYDSAYTFIFSPRPGTRAAAMEDEFVAPEVIAERFERLKTVVDRSSLARHQARVGTDGGGAGRRGEPPRRGDADGADPPGEAGPLRADGAGNARDAHRGRPGPGHHHRPGIRTISRDGWTRSRPGRGTGCGSPWPALERRRPPRRHGVGEVRGGARRWPAGGVTSRSSRWTPCASTGAWTSGTSKPSRAQQAEVPHHLLDLVDPDEEFTVRQFQQAARRALEDIAARGHHALLVGGTGLYLRAVVDDLRFPGRYPDGPGGPGVRAGRGPGRRARAPRPAGRPRPGGGRTAWSPPTSAGWCGRSRSRSGSGQPFSTFGPGLEAYPLSPVTMVGLDVPIEEVDRRIAERFGRWMEEGLLDEVRALAARPGGISRTARQALGYRELLAHVEEGAPLDACVEEAVRRTRSFARRQASWFRRDPRIVLDRGRAWAPPICSTGPWGRTHRGP